MTPIEIIALIFVVIGIIKLITLLINPSKWIKVIDTVYKKPAITMIIALILAAIMLNYLLAELTIVQIFAVMAFLGSLMILNIVNYSKEISTLAKKILKDKNILKKAWLSTIIWIALMFWVLYAIFV